MSIQLFSYINPFGDGKLRPGFELNNRLYVLTHTQPHDAKFFFVKGEAIKGDYFQGSSQLSYVRSCARVPRYNDVSGGVLTLTQEQLECLSSI